MLLIVYFEFFRTIYQVSMDTKDLKQAAFMRKVRNSHFLMAKVGTIKVLAFPRLNEFMLSEL